VGRILIKVVINALALYIAAAIMDFPLSTNVGELLLLGLIFGGLNAIVRPVLSFFTCPFYILTLGLFTFVMNVFILWILEWVVEFLGRDSVAFGGFWNTLAVGIIVSLVSLVLSLLFGLHEDED